MFEAPWICSAVPGKPKQLRNALTSLTGVGASPRIATRDALALQAAGLQLGDPVSAEDLVREQAGGGEHRRGVRRAWRSPGSIVPVRVGVPPATEAVAPCRAGAGPSWRMRSG